MGLGSRIFLVDDDNVRRFPFSRYEWLRREDPNESLPEFAGKRVRCAEVIIVSIGFWVRRPFDNSHQLFNNGFLVSNDEGIGWGIRHNAAVLRQEWRQNGC